MRQIYSLFVLVACGLLLAGCPGGSSSDTLDSGVDSSTEKTAMLTRHNDTRASLGLNALAMDSRLSSIAQAQAEYMLSIGELSHTDGSGGSVGDRATAVSYSWTEVGENIALTASGTAAYEAWLASSGHYANITNAAFEDVGIGLAVSGSAQYWCVVFGVE